MVRIQRSALVPHSAEQMFDLVNDIENYPSFMHGCKAARVISRSEHELVGELSLAKAGISQSFTTRNRLDRPNTIEMELVEGSFTSFHALWSFTALGDAACEVRLEMEFEYKLGLLQFAAEQLFNNSANKLVDALVQRASKVYG
jgi:ribosome-associated toxin RatA of RatAB toxin-antitoxin module